MKERVLFLDRDGVINIDTGYAHQPEQIIFIDGIFDLARRAHALGYKIVIVTNQAGIGRGYYNEAAFHSLMQWMSARFADEGAPVAAYYFCPHHPEHGVGEYHVACECRKPKPGMFEKAAKEHVIDMAASIMIGDKESDIEAAKLAGVGKLWQLAHESSAVLHPDARMVTSHQVILEEWENETCP